MTYRAASPGSATTFESEPVGCGCGLGMSVVFVPMWAIPVGIANEWWDRGFSPIFVVLALVDVALWIGLVYLVTGGARLTLDGEGLRWDVYRAFGPLTMPARASSSATALRRGSKPASHAAARATSTRRDPGFRWDSHGRMASRSHRRTRFRCTAPPTFLLAVIPTRTASSGKVSTCRTVSGPAHDRPRP